MLLMILLPSMGNPRYDKTTKRATAIEQKRRVVSVAARAEVIRLGVKNLLFSVSDSARVSVAKVETNVLRFVDETKDDLGSLPSEAGLCLASGLISDVLKGGT